MIASMTGFGRGEASAAGFEAVVELKSVNSRYCEVSIRSPRVLSDKDGEVQRVVKSAFARGRISVQIQVDSPSESEAALTLDTEAVTRYTRLLESLKTVSGVDEEIRLDHFLRFQDIFRPEREDTDQATRTWAAVDEALSLACDAMKKMRLDEGAALERELVARLGSIEENLRIVEMEAPERIPRAHDRLKARLEEVIEDGRIDNDRLEFEMALLADRLDIREECVRLHSHLNLFREAISSGDPVGRKLNFLSQEMNREVNTIGSKASDAGLSHLVVAMKEDLEKIREQVENVE
jgi:uncharacterized protein (TIGR00255 family)